MANLSSAGFSSGFSNQMMSPQGAVGSQLAQDQYQKMSKLQLAFESQRIEAEIKAQQAANTIPDDQYQKLTSQIADYGSALASGQPAPKLDFSGFGPKAQQAGLGLLGNLLQASGRAAVLNTVTPHPVTDAQGKQHMVLFNRRGQQVGDIPTEGMSQKDRDELQQLTATYGDWQELKNSFSGIDFGRISGLGSKTMGALGLNPEMAKFNAAKVNLTTQMPAILAGFKRFNDPEYKRLEQSQVSATSTPQEVKNFVDLYDGIFARRFATKGVDYRNLNANGLNLNNPDVQRTGGNPANPPPKSPVSGGDNMLDAIRAEKARRAANRGQ